MSERARGKAPTSVVTSDVARPRILALAALGAALGVSGVVVAEGAPLARDMPIARPHAKVGCASCHSESSSDETQPPRHVSAACTSCHTTPHVSTRASHRSLAVKGKLPCATCHGQHSTAQGLTFDGDDVIRWGAGRDVRVRPPRASGVAAGAIPAKTNVPLVSLAACAKCHDPTKAADPISMCVPAAARNLDADAGVGALRTIASQCFDEHRTLDDSRSPRFVVWDAAREISTTTSWVPPRRQDGTPWTPAAGALAGALVLGVAGAAADRRKRRAEGTNKPRAVATPSERKRLPTINPTTCLGCYACVDACPFDVLAIERYVAVVARPDECCGVVTCEQVCPNGSLRVEDGEPILDRPATDDDLESRDVRGLFLAGDLTGLPLIKNAIHQGARAVDRIVATAPKGRGAAIDVLVVGAGPAGLSAALRAVEKGLRCVVIEQATIAASIKSFPRDKIVHDPPLDIPSIGELWLKEATKEEIVAQWSRIVRARSLDVREGHRVVDLRKDGEGFVVTAEVADTGAAAASNGARSTEFRAARVVLAIGRRGTPQRIPLAIERGAEDRVLYALADARSFAGKRVVVVGLGDAAMEAAIALARQPGTQVAISYRGSRFSRGKSKNISEVEALVAKRKIRLLFETVPVAVGGAAVTLEGTGAHGGRRSVAADAMLVLIGGVPAWDLLLRAGIRRPGASERTSAEGVPKAAV